ncbi:alpha/beta fold hydrolase [Nocardia sp. NPDC059691]|uniref:alpha/beta fold hydrolase n=1 Tax=Nocardia sp. NPDC059691 TaxID=3346908 RepID=UPI0036BA4449
MVPRPGGELSVLLRRSAGAARTPVVLIHGINGAARDWSHVMELLSDRPVLAIDLSGHGGSAPWCRYDAQTYAEDIMTVLDHFALGEVHLVGASFGGGAVITVAAQRRVQVRSLTIVGGALSLAGIADVDQIAAELRRLGPAAFFEMVAEASFAPGTDRAVIDETVQLAALRDIDTIEGIMRDALAADVSAAAASVQAPTLVLTGEYDQTCPPALGAALARALRGHHEILPGRGHMAHVEDPGTVADRIDEHLAMAEADVSVVEG